MNPFLNKSSTIIYSLVLMAFCAFVSWNSTMFLGIPVFIEPGMIVKVQNFVNRYLFNFPTTNGIS